MLFIKNLTKYDSLVRQQDYGHPMKFSLENKTHRPIKYLIILNEYKII